MNDQSNSPDRNKGWFKDRKNVLQYIIQRVEKGTGLSLQELHEKYSEDKVFYQGLKHVTTTKKAFCEAMGIPVEAGCRYKRKLEKAGHLVQSVDDMVCPFTKHMAKLITTNPREFDRLRKTNSKQLNLFEV